MSTARAIRRAGAALLGAWACASSQAHDDEAAAAARLPRRIALLARAQGELERGDAAQALDDFERAAMMLHAADAELGLIRAAMQDGQYRRALAFCAHTAGEHTDAADGAALYAWLLRIGGQDELAARTLAEARARMPGDPVAAAVSTAFTEHPAVATGVLLQASHRMAPWPVTGDAQASPPASARLAGNGTLLDDGATALVPLAGLKAGAGALVWVRNGLGQATEATVDPAPPALAAHGLARLRLRTALSAGTPRESAARTPYAGSPGYALAYGPAPGPAWPALTQGFLGSAKGDAGERRLGFGSAPGAPVFDATGALIGVVLDAGDAPSTWLPASTWAPPSAPASPPAAAAQAPRALALAAPGDIYEVGLRRALQVLVDRGP